MVHFVATMADSHSHGVLRSTAAPAPQSNETDMPSFRDSVRTALAAALLAAVAPLALATTGAAPAQAQADGAVRAAAAPTSDADSSGTAGPALRVAHAASDAVLTTASLQARPTTSVNGLSDSDTQARRAEPSLLVIIAAGLVVVVFVSSRRRPKR